MISTSNRPRAAFLNPFLVTGLGVFIAAAILIGGRVANDQDLTKVAAVKLRQIEPIVVSGVEGLAGPSLKPEPLPEPNVIATLPAPPEVVSSISIETAGEISASQAQVRKMQSLFVRRELFYPDNILLAGQTWIPPRPTGVDVHLTPASSTHEPSPWGRLLACDCLLSKPVFDVAVLVPTAQDPRPKVRPTPEQVKKNARARRRAAAAARKARAEKAKAEEEALQSKTKKKRKRPTRSTADS